MGHYITALFGLVTWSLKKCKYFIIVILPIHAKIVTQMKSMLQLNQEENP